MNNWPQLTIGLNALLRDLRGGAPAIMRAFAGIAQAATASNALDFENKELIALGIAVAMRCDDCIAFHAKAAVEHGATKDEVSETLGTLWVRKSCFRSVHAVRGIKATRALTKRSMQSATFRRASLGPAPSQSAPAPVDVY